MNAFMAVMIGLGNQAVSRLNGTWDKLPTKYKKLMMEFEAILVSRDSLENVAVYGKLEILITLTLRILSGKIRIFQLLFRFRGLKVDDFCLVARLAFFRRNVHC